MLDEDFWKLQYNILLKCKKKRSVKNSEFIQKTQAKIEKMHNEGEINLDQFIEICELLVSLYKAP